MARETLKARLAREAREYLADLRELRDDLKSAEGWIAFFLLLAAALIAAAWFVVSLGFNPANEHINSWLYRLGLHSCRPLDNFSGVVIFVDFVLLIFLTVISLGNALNMMRRVRRGQPRRPRDLIVSAALMLVAGIGGIVFMRWVC